VDYYRVPRATIDIDLNIFVAPQEHAGVIAAFSDWDETRIDLFFAVFDFHDSMAKRARLVPYESTSIPILSAEDILLAKAIFDRTHPSWLTEGGV
jgi:hypothetical protein